MIDSNIVLGSRIFYSIYQLEFTQSLDMQSGNLHKVQRIMQALKLNCLKENCNEEKKIKYYKTAVR